MAIKVALNLEQHPLLASMPREALDEFARHASRATLRADKIIVLEGDPCQQVGLVMSGLLRQRHLSPEGRQHVLGYLGPGSCYGLASALAGQDHGATLDVLVDATIFWLDCDVFERLAATWPGLGVAVAADLAREATRLQEMVKDLALYSVRARLARFLLENVEQGPPQHQWTQTLIAEHIGTVRDVVGRVMRAFVEEGLIRRQQGRMVILDGEALRCEAEHG